MISFDLPFPPANVGPQQVRAYIAQLLIARHDTTAEFAEQTADLWQLGRGADFRRATTANSTAAYTRIFGQAVGPYLYYSAREELRTEYLASTLAILNRWGIAIFTVVGGLLLIRLSRPSGPRNKFIALGDALMVIGPVWTIYALIELVNKPGCSAVEGILLGLGLFACVLAFFSIIERNSSPSLPRISQNEGKKKE